MNSRHYRDARMIEQGLEQAGRPDWALRVDDAIEGGSLASEILTRLRTTLVLIQGQAPDLPAPLADQIEQLARVQAGLTSAHSCS